MLELLFAFACSRCLWLVWPQGAQQNKQDEPTACRVIT